MKVRSLPLGIDIGSTRIRILELHRGAQGVELRAAAVREVSIETNAGGTEMSQYLGALIEDALAELGTSQRRCVCAIGQPDAVLHVLKLPKMTAFERERAARFEAARFIDYPIEEAVVRIHAFERASGTWALGIVRRSALLSRVAVLRAAGLKPIAMDHEACALARALPGFDAVIDVGHQRTGLHVLRAGETPMTLQAYNGGADITRGIARDLLVDTRTAEKRKRILGTAGAGERARVALLSDIAGLIRHARGSHVIQRVALVGNASRLGGLAAALESTTGVLCEVPVSEALRGAAYPDDVIRSSAPDWTLAAGLARWSIN